MHQRVAPFTLHKFSQSNTHHKVIASMGGYKASPSISLNQFNLPEALGLTDKLSTARSSSIARDLPNSSKPKIRPSRRPNHMIKFRASLKVAAAVLLRLSMGLTLCGVIRGPGFRSLEGIRRGCLYNSPLSLVLGITQTGLSRLGYGLRPLSCSERLCRAPCMQ